MLYIERMYTMLKLKTKVTCHRVVIKTLANWLKAFIAFSLKVCIVTMLYLCEELYLVQLKLNSL